MLILLCLSNYVVELLIILLVTEEVFGCHLLVKDRQWPCLMQTSLVILQNLLLLVVTH